MVFLADITALPGTTRQMWNCFWIAFECRRDQAQVDEDRRPRASSSNLEFRFIEGSLLIRCQQKKLLAQTPKNLKRHRGHNRFCNRTVQVSRRSRTMMVLPVYTGNGQHLTSRNKSAAWT